MSNRFNEFPNHGAQSHFQAPTNRLTRLDALANNLASATKIPQRESERSQAWDNTRMVALYGVHLAIVRSRKQNCVIVHLPTSQINITEIDKDWLAMRVLSKNRATDAMYHFELGPDKTLEYHAINNALINWGKTDVDIQPSRAAAVLDLGFQAAVATGHPNYPARMFE